MSDVDLPSGLMLRDYIAIQAMCAMLPRLRNAGIEEFASDFRWDVARYAYIAADEMLKERERREPA